MRNVMNGRRGVPSPVCSCGGLGLLKTFLEFSCTGVGLDRLSWCFLVYASALLRIFQV